MRRVAGAEETGSEEPEAAAALVLDAVIGPDVVGIAEMGGGIRGAPPFRGDALRPVGAAHAMEEPAPAEENGRIVRHRRRRLDRLGRDEKANRAWRSGRPARCVLAALC